MVSAAILPPRNTYVAGVGCYRLVRLEGRKVSSLSRWVGARTTALGRSLPVISIDFLPIEPLLYTPIAATQELQFGQVTDDRMPEPLSPPHLTDLSVLRCNIDSSADTMIILNWILTQVFGVMTSLALVLRDEAATPNDITFSLSNSIYYADQLFWIGLTLTLYPLIDIIFRVGKLYGPEMAIQVIYCGGAINAYILSAAILTAIVFAISFGMVVMAEPSQLIENLPFDVLKGYKFVFLGAIIASVLYVLRLQVLHTIHRDASAG